MAAAHALVQHCPSSTAAVPGELRIHACHSGSDHVGDCANAHQASTTGGQAMQGRPAWRACDVAVRAAGKAGVALSTLGPGATNFTTSAAYAQLGGFPMLLITGVHVSDRPSAAQPRKRLNVVLKDLAGCEGLYAKDELTSAACAATARPDVLRRGGGRPEARAQEQAGRVPDRQQRGDVQAAVQVH